MIVTNIKCPRCKAPVFGQISVSCDENWNPVGTPSKEYCPSCAYMKGDDLELEKVQELVEGKV